MNAGCGCCLFFNRLKKMELVISPECVPELLRMYNISRWKEVSIIFANRVESVSEFYFSLILQYYMYIIFLERNNFDAKTRSKVLCQNRKLLKSWKKRSRSIPLYDISLQLL